MAIRAMEKNKKGRGSNITERKGWESCALNRAVRDCPGGPVVKTPCFHRRGDTGLIPGQGTKIPHAVRCVVAKKNDS